MAKKKTTSTEIAFSLIILASPEASGLSKSEGEAIIFYLLLFDKTFYRSCFLISNF
jgi:hypothetical protein